MKKIVAKFLFVFACLTLLVPVAWADMVIKGNDIILDTTYQLQEQKTEKTALFEKNIFHYINGLKIETYLLSNTDVVYFATYSPVNDSIAEFSIGLSGSAIAMDGSWVSYPDGRLAIENGKLVSGNLPKGSALLGDHVFISQADVFAWSNNDVITSKQKMVLAPVYKNDENTGVVTIRLNGKAGLWASQWGVLSSSNLVEDKSAFEQGMLTADLTQKRKLISSGFLEPLPLDYRPNSIDSFWWCPAQHLGNFFISDSYSNVRLFDDLVQINGYQIINRQNAMGYWETRPESGWLKNDYGIAAGFYDTRFCTDAATLLLSMYEKNKDEKLLQAAEKYAGYLQNHISRGKTIGNGVLVPDYWHDTKSFFATPHTSLNHQLAEMNFLLRMNIATGNQVYRDAADQLKNGIRETGVHWIKDDGDLWYCIDSNGTYLKKDYPTLTLNDLNQSLQLIEKVEGEQDTVLKILRDSKYSYAVRSGYIGRKG